MHSTLSVPLECDQSSPAIASSRVVAFVEPRASERLVTNLSLLVNEVVTNAVVHGGSSIYLEIYVFAAYAVRVEVFDASFDLPEMQSLLPDGQSGRGLHLVDALANKWGARRRADGKVVWFELHDKTRCSPGRPVGAPTRADPDQPSRRAIGVKDTDRLRQTNAVR
jgi:anti-sigma regulatory factor (Ser/Thr protein kinase)